MSIVTWEFESPPLHYFKNAEIAQLVEHNLAKVGVAGPSPVFRSFRFKRTCVLGKFAQVAELVDAHVSGACIARCAGSSPVLGTIKYLYPFRYLRILYRKECDNT